jgi:hypothetical protein
MRPSPSSSADIITSHFLLFSLLCTLSTAGSVSSFVCYFPLLSGDIRDNKEHQFVAFLLILSFFVDQRQASSIVLELLKVIPFVAFLCFHPQIPFASFVSLHSYGCSFVGFELNK